MSSRLPQVPGEWIDRNRPLSFHFEGRRCTGYEGDTVSSALLSSGVRVLGRSFKYHRPRGVLSFANHDVNALLQDGETLNLRADVTPVREGMRLVATNTIGGLDSDRAQLIELFSRFLPVGFYYKAFYSKRWFPRWERMFRAVAGLGRVDFAAPRIRTAKRYDFCDVLVIGAGPSGLSAAIAAADAGANTVLVEESARPGGSGAFNLGGDCGERERIDALLRRLKLLPGLSVRTGTTAAGFYADNWIALIDAERMTKLRARAVIVCSGAYEQPAVFRNNDLPGVMLASAAQRLIHRYAVRPFQRAVLLAANADAYRAALDFAAHAIEVAAIVDMRPEGEQSALAQRVAAAAIPVLRGHCIIEANGTRAVSSVAVAPIGKDGVPVPGQAKRIACDGVAMSVGWAPAANLLYQAGAQMRFASELEQFVPQILPAGVFAAGRVAGAYEFENRMRDGERAGLGAARYLGLSPAKDVPPPAPERYLPSHPYPFVAHAKGKNFVDFDEDLVLADLHNTAQEGFDNIELFKRFSTVGMGPSQGKHSNMNAVRILARIRGEPVDAIGTTTARPFFHPVPMALLAGRSFHAERRTPLHSRHEALGAKFMPAANWWRPEYYRRANMTREQCIRDEVLAVRQQVGVIDVGTLGKIEISGPGAAEFLERVYTGRFADLRPGMTRYGLMLDESGVVVDDGVIARLGEDRFYFTTTTAGAASVYRELTRLNTMWRLECGFVNVTGHLAAVNLAGPKSREALSKLTQADIADDAFPYLAVRELELRGIPARAMRVGFVGELGYELHVPADLGCALWDLLMEVGQPAGIRAFGVEAQRLLRLEKGHIIVGQDTDGLTTPAEAACGWAVKMDKRFFIGQRSLRIVQQKPLRQALVGFELPPGAQAEQVLECHLVIAQGRIAGRVTSVAWSPALSRHIGLAMVNPSLAREGGGFAIRTTDGRTVEAKVVKPPFYDRGGHRQKPGEAA